MTTIFCSNISEVHPHKYSPLLNTIELKIVHTANITVASHSIHLKMFLKERNIHVRYLQSHKLGGALNMIDRGSEGPLGE